MVDKISNSWETLTKIKMECSKAVKRALDGITYPGPDPIKAFSA